jgi:serine/threonine protein kinase
MPESPTDLSDAPQIDNVEILGLIGRGGMSLVYKARQLELDRIVAVKVLQSQKLGGEAGIKRFQKEAKLSGALDHANIAKTISFGISNDSQPFMIMEYLEGSSLAEYLKQNGRLSLRRFKDTFLPILSALQAAHSAGLIHRDIKPGNIMYCRSDSGNETVKLVDFGIAKSFADEENKSAALTATGALLGSPAYMSPEQCQSQPMDNRSDLYSLACVMYESLCGAPPFAADSALELMQKHSVEPPPTVQDFLKTIRANKDLAETIIWSLAKKPADRPQSAAEFSTRLQNALEGADLDRVPALGQSASPFSGKLKIIALLACFALFLICLKLLNPSQSGLTQMPKPSADSGELDAFAMGEKNRKKELEIAEQRINKSAQIAPLLNLAVYYDREKKAELAIPYYVRLKNIKENEPGYPDRILIETYIGLAHCYKLTHEWNKAEPIYKRLLQIHENQFGFNGSELDRDLYDLGTCYDYEDKMDLAAATTLRLIDLRKNDGDSPEHVDEAWERLGNCYRRHDNGKEALAIYARLLKARKDSADRDAYASILYKMASCYEENHDWKNAVDFRRREIDLIQNEHLSGESLDKIYRSLADDCLLIGDPKDAISACYKAIAAREKISPHDTAFANHIKIRLARAYIEQENFAEAQKVFEALLKSDDKNLDRERGLFWNLDQIRDCCFKLHHDAESIPFQKRSLAIREKELGSNHPEISVRLKLLACTYDRLGEKQESAPLWQRVAKIDEAAKTTNSAAESPKKN